MNEIQIKLLDVAKSFIEVCNQLNLQYFAIGGTCLGSVRHSGFIPWDDDIDFVMPREDYNVFVTHGQKYLKKNLFIQTHETDKHYFSPYAKVRDSNTTAIEEATKKTKMNQGLWIDIFPLDSIVFSKKKWNKYNFLRLYILERRYLPGRYSWGGFKNRMLNLFVFILLPSKKIAFRINSYLIKKCIDEDSDYLWWNWPKMGNPLLKKEWFSSYVNGDFENIKIRLPIGRFDYLNEHYGDWKILPPLSQRQSNHSIIKLDLSKSYRIYLDNR